MQIILSMYTI